MTLAVAAVCLFVLALPGIAARRAYLSGVFSRAHVRLTLTDEIAVSLIFAVPFHVMGCIVAHSLHHPVDPVLLGRLLTGEFGADGVELAGAFSRLLHDWRRIIGYGLFVNVAAVVAGHGWRWMVRQRQWDRRFEYFRFGNSWYYLLSGEILDFPGNLGSSEDIDFVWLDVLVEAGGSPIIYSGIFHEYSLASDGGLNRLYIRRAERKLLPSSQPTPKAGGTTTLESVSIPGHYLVIPASKILNLNVTYLELNPAADTGDSSKTPPVDAPRNGA